MSLDLWMALAVFALVSTITPGPNNVLFLASGLNVGVVRSLPFLAGVNTGFSIMLAAVGLGLGQAFAAFPWLYVALTYVGAAYLLYLAWRLARAPVQRREIDGEQFLGFWKGATLQAVNPKAWVMCVTALAVYTPLEGFTGNVVIVIATFLLFGIPSNLLWVVGGTALQGLLESELRMRMFNIAMALLLVLSIVPVLAT